VEAEDIVTAIAAEVEKERLEKQKANAANQHAEPSGKDFPEATKPHANEAEDIVQAITAEVEKERREKISEARKTETGQIFVQSPHANDTATKLAETFPTNRTYINAAAKIIETAPDIAERVKAGTMTMQDARREAVPRQYLPVVGCRCCTIHE